jgi:hypothetical protein
MNRTARLGENIFNIIHDKGIISRIHKELSKLIKKKTDKRFEMLITVISKMKKTDHTKCRQGHT